jgi:hypothetical protein
MKWLNCEKMRLLLVGFLAVVVVGSGIAKADFVWTQKADMPTPRWSHTSATVNGKIYVIGGAPSEPDESVLSVLEEYDPATDTWTRKADMPTARGWISPSSAVVDGKIYVIGGWDGIGSTPTSIVEEYDPATDIWTRKADMPTGRDSTATVAVDGKIYVIGGAVGGALGRKIVEQYDPVTDTWTTKADMPTYLWGLCANVVNGKIYTVGGRKSIDAETFVQEYDPATDTWTQKANMPVATSQMGSVVLDNKIIVIGGWLMSMLYPYTTIQIYDTEKDIWTMEADTSFHRACFSAEVVRGRIFAIGGTDRPHPCPATSTVFECGPLVDFNRDGIVDSADVCIMVDHWGSNNSLCDIGPTPWGDGIVDVEDLKVLAEHFFKEVDDPTLIAHWALDETEGIIAYNSASVNDAVVVGGAVWQPSSGQIDGALQLDGINSYLVAGPVLNPANGPFSVFVWVKGGVPGQVFISQLDGDGTGIGNTWLGTDAEDGNLMTGLVSPSAGWVAIKPLVSESIISDGQWHHIGFVWDGSYRILYADGIEVAKDTAAQNPLKPADGGLYIGASKTLTAGTFFSGLIDDVRIYNRAVKP